MNLKDNPFPTIDELEERLHDAHRAGEQAQPIPDAAREHLVLAQEYLRGLKDHMTDLQIGRDIEEVDIKDARFEIAQALIREAESLIDGTHAAIEHERVLNHEQHRDFYTQLGLENPEPERDSPEDTFLVSINCEHWTPEDLEAGQSSWSDTEVERQVVDADELRRLAQDHGLNSPSASDPRQTRTLWFSSTKPPEDRAYFEQGVHKYYSLHIHEVNGHHPKPTDYQRVSDLIGARFDHPLQQHNPTHEMEGPDL